MAKAIDPGPARALVSCVALLRGRLDVIEAKMMELLDCSTVRIREDDPYSSIVVIGPNVFWGKPDEKQSRLQIELKGLYTDWAEQFQLLASGITNDLQGEIKEKDQFVRRWIEKDSSWDILSSMEDNKRRFLEETKTFRDVLSTLEDPNQSRVVVVPDTNALIRCPDVAGYSTVAGDGPFDVVLLPTVLGELDELKIKSRDSAFREKVEGVIRRVKGWRTQGSLLSGVTVDRRITVRTVAREPDFARTLRWLDKDNRDDRIVASMLELQRAMPWAAIVLVTGDINLQNKAEAASLPYAETP